MPEPKRRIDRSKMTAAQREMLDERAAMMHRVRAFPENEGVRPIDEPHRELIGQAEALLEGLTRFAARKAFRGRANGLLTKEAVGAMKRSLIALRAVRLPQSDGDE